MLGETPSKPFEVVVATQGQADKIVTWGSDLPSLLGEYEKARKQARKDKKEDGRLRWVSIRHYLVRDTI